MDKLQEIKEACWRANPSILDLKFGCELQDIMNPDWIWLYYHDDIGGRGGEKRIAVWRKEIGIGYGEKREFKILGRPIRLSDVLLMMTKTLKVSELAMEGWLQIITGEKWKLDDDDLSHQSPKTIDFIAGLLK